MTARRPRIPNTAVPGGSGAGCIGGEFETVLNIPNVPSLIGLRIFGQGVILTQGGFLFSTNPDAKEIS